MEIKKSKQKPANKPEKEGFKNEQTFINQKFNYQPPARSKCFEIEESFINLNQNIINRFYYMKFEDADIEEKYLNYLYLNFNKQMYFMVHLFLIVNLILKITVTKCKFYLPIIITDCTIIALISANAFYYQFSTKIKLKETLNKILGFVIITTEFAHSILYFAFLSSENVTCIGYCNNGLYVLVLMIFLIFLFSIEEYFCFTLAFMLINLIIFYFFYFTKAELSSFNYYEITVYTIALFMLLLIKNNFSLFLREIFIKIYKFKRYYLYFKEIINNMNAFLISSAEHKIEFSNKAYNKFFLKKKNKKKFLNDIFDTDKFAAFIKKYSDLVNSGDVNLENFINLKILENESYKNDKDLFISLLKKEIKFRIKCNKKLLFKNKKSNNNNNEKEMINNNINPEANKKVQEDEHLNIIENEEDIKTSQRLMELNNKNNNNLCGDFSMNKDNLNRYKSPHNGNNIHLYGNSIYNNGPEDYKYKIFQQQETNCDIKDIKIDKPIDPIISDENLLKKFQEFKINYSHMRKIYLENLYPVELNIKNVNQKKRIADHNEDNLFIEQVNEGKMIDQKNSVFQSNDCLISLELIDKSENLSKSINIENSLEGDSFTENNKKLNFDLNVNLKRRNLMQISELIETNFSGKNKFYYLGEFKNIFDKKFYQIFFRKNALNSRNKNQDYYTSNINAKNIASSFSGEKSSNPNFNTFTNQKNKNNLVDFLIYNITKIREVERLESKLKAKFLGKIAHEFKTPINSILGLIKKILFNMENEEDNNNFKDLPKDIQQVENLCSYTLFLIDDIIEYSFKSNYSNSILNSSSEKSSICPINSNIIKFDLEGKNGKNNIYGGNKNKINDNALNNCNSNQMEINQLERNEITEQRGNAKSKAFNKNQEKENKILPPTFNNYEEKENNPMNLIKRGDSKIFGKKSNFASHSMAVKNNYKKNNQFHNDIIKEENDNVINNYATTNENMIINDSLSNKWKIKKKNKILVNLDEVNFEEITLFCKGVAETLLISKGKEKNVKIDFNYDEEINNYKIYSDEFRVKQIILNFLSNAVKFTKSGYILINSCIIDNKLKISVIDSGIGIKKEEIKYLFKDKFMSETTKKYNQAGSGLGLSISKSIADRLGIAIDVKSELGKGSEFSIIIKCSGKKKSKSKISDINFEEQYNLNLKACSFKNALGSFYNSEVKESLENEYSEKEKIEFNKIKFLKNLDDNNNFSNTVAKNNALLTSLNMNESQCDSIIYNNNFNNKNDLSDPKNVNSFNNQDIENDFSCSNINTVKLNNTNHTGNRNYFCFKIENYEHIFEDINLKTKESDSKEDSNKSNKPVEELLEKTEENIASVIIIQNPNETETNLDFNLDNLLDNMNLADYNIDNKTQNLKQNFSIDAHTLNNLNNNKLSHLGAIDAKNGNNYNLNYNTATNNNLNFSFNSNIDLFNFIQDNSSDDNITNNKAQHNQSNLEFYLEEESISFEKYLLDLNNPFVNINPSKFSKQSNAYNNIILNENSSNYSSCKDRNANKGSNSSKSPDKKKKFIDHNDFMIKENDVFSNASRSHSSKNFANLNLNTVNNINIKANNVNISTFLSVKNKKNNNTQNNNNNHQNILQYNHDNVNIVYPQNEAVICPKYSQSKFNKNNNAVDNIQSNHQDKKKPKKSYFSKDRNDVVILNEQNKSYILIVDDHTFIRSSLKINLEKIFKENKIENFEILEGTDGVDILNFIIKDQEKNNSIKCIFSDENMEYINGFEAFEILKRLQMENKIKKIPFCSVTAFEETELIKGKNSKHKDVVDKILIKPCTQNDLLQFLHEYKII